jgi:hypothetical protein
LTAETALVFSTPPARSVFRMVHCFVLRQTRELESQPQNEVKDLDVPTMDSGVFSGFGPKKSEKTLKKREKVLAFPEIRGILKSHYASKQSGQLQF